MEATSTASPQPLRILRGHGAPVNTVCAVAATRIASGSADGIVKLWDLKSCRETSSVSAHSKAGVLHATRLDDRRMVTHGRDGSIKLWDIDSFYSASTPLNEWYCGSFTFTKVATMRWRDASESSDFDDLIVSPSAEEKNILVYDPRMGNSMPAMFIRLPDPEKKRGMCMSLSLFMGPSHSTPEEQTAGTRHHHQPYIAAGWEGGQLALIDLRSGGKLLSQVQVSTGTNPLLAFDVSADGSTAICGSSAEELSAVTIDYTSLTMTSSPFFKSNNGGISSVRMRGDQRIFATAGWDHRVRIFHTKKLKPLAILKYHTESVFSVDFTPDSNFLVSSSKDHKLALWSVYPPSSSSAHNLLRPY